MMKRFLFLTLVVAFILGACTGGKDQVNPAQDATSIARAVAETLNARATATETETPLPTVQVIKDTPTPIPLGEAMPCALMSLNPTPNATLQALFPGSLPGDWVNGADTAFITITEYSDFQ